MMRLNSMKPAAGSKRPRLRVGRGASAGQGKTCGRGVKGQRARKGGYHKVGFEGGQMPLQRRMPKVGFRSAMKSTRAEVRLSELAKVTGTIVDLAVLKKINVVPVHAQVVKIVLSGSVDRALTIQGLLVTRGARAAIEAAGGRVEGAAEAATVAAPSVTSSFDAKAAKAAGFKLSGPDDLTVVEGIGPKIDELLRANGVGTFAQLSRTSPETISGILAKGGPRFAIAKPDTWPTQAALAAENRWVDLKQLQDALVAGVEKKS